MSTRRLTIAAVALALAGWVVFFAWLLRPYPADALARRGSLSLTDRRGEVLRVLPLPGGGRARWVPLDRIPPQVVLATLAGEDHRFYAHPGVDLRAIARAAWLLLARGRAVSGASTLTMQLARAIEPHPRTLLGKLREGVIALRLERALDKPAILEQYLNRVSYGAGAVGVEAAAWSTFGKPAAALGAGEASLLAVLPRAPVRYDLRRADGRAAALARRAHVLALMERHGWLEPGARARLEAEPLTFTAARPPEAAPHFVDWVLGGLAPDRRGAGGTLTTTLDLTLQRRLEAAVARHVADRPGRAPEAGLVVLAPATGDVLAMVGSPDHAARPGGQINITTTPRHPGSTLKPFVYALAIERGAHPASLADDRVAAVPGLRPSGRERERGPARFREALAGSYNLAAQSVLAGLGVAPVLERLRRAGLGPLAAGAEHGLSLALGSARVRLVDLAAAYGAFVSGGVVTRARALPGPPARVRLFDPATSWLVMDMLADPAARRSVFGAELPVDLPFAVAVKTGTSAGYADTVAIAATQEVVVAAWAGAFDGSGTRGQLAMWSAAPLARAALLAVADQRRRPLGLPARPPGLHAADLCGVSGLLAAAPCPSKHEYLARAVTLARCDGRH